jgi:hypothetical protein
VSDFRLKVIAETQAAESSLKQVDKVANEATRARNLKIEIPNYSDLSNNFRDLNKDISSAANGIKDFYKVASKLPVGPLNEINELAGQLKRVAVTATDTGRNVGDAGDVIKATFNATNKAAETLVSRLTRIALSLYVIKEAAGLIQGAFGGMFNETIGREVKLRETILKTQTTLASTNKVFKDGKEITDPYQKIVTLTGAVRKNIDSIRERSIALAGVTSGEVIEVFGIVAAQVGQIGGGLKEAEDLAINFAAALGTFGIPLYQARQEIGSILRGDITVDSYLAKALGITNEDIAKAKTATGGVVKFLEERLAAAVAGQRIAAEGFSGVVSNIKDLSELVNQNFGAGLLDPLLDSLTKVFNFLFSIRNEIFAISKLAGESIGTVADTVLKMVGGATGGARQTQLEGGGTFNPALGNAPVLPMQRKVTSDFGADDALNAAKATVNYVKVEVSKAFSTVYLQISTLLERVSSAFLAVGGGLAMLAKGLLSLKLESFKALIGAVESISPALLVAAKGLGAFLDLWGKFMELPLVQELAQIGVGMRALEATGVMGLVRSGFILQGVISNWGKIIGFVTTQFNALRSMIGGVIAWIGQLIAQAGRAGVALLTAWTPASKALQALRAELLSTVAQFEVVGNSAQKAGAKIGGFNANVKNAGGGIVGLIGGMIKFQLIMFAISAAVSLAMERFSAYKEAQDKIANDKRVQEAIRRLATTYKDLGENATEAQKRARAFEVSLVDQDYDKALANLEKVNKKLEELRDLSNERIGNWLQRTLQAMNLANMDVKPQKGESFSDAVYRTRLKERAAAELEVSKKAREVDKIAGQANVELIANKKIDLSKEIAELERQQQNDLFQQRQTLAQKEVEIFRAAGELRIFHMEQANAKLIEGEEGASRTALEALNNYLSVRENGELEIEAAKKDIAIEVANLEKTIADYRFENEKKIAEIRKRSGENEKAMADAQRQAAGQAPAAPGVSEGFRVGSTGRSSGPHLDIRGSDRESVVREAASIIKAWQGQNLPYITLPNANIDVKNMTDEAALLKALRKEQVAHDTTRNRRIGQSQGAIDIAVPSGTLVPTPASAPSWGGAGGWQATSQATGNRFLHGLKDSKASPPGAAPAAAPTPALQSLDVLAPATEAYAAAVRGVASAMERVRALQAALTKAQTVAAFEEIAKAAFPQVQLEGYEDNLFTVQATYDAVAASAASAFDPERAAITIDRTMKTAAANREVKQIMDEVEKRQKSGLITQKERNKLEDDLAAKKKNYLADLAKEEEAKKRILTIQQASAFLQSLKTDTAAIYEEIEIINKRNELELAGESPERIQAELNKLAINKELQRQLTAINAALAEQLVKRDAIAASIAKAQPKDVANLQKDLDAANAEIARLTAAQTALPAAAGAKGMAEDYKVAAQTKTEPQKIESRLATVKKELKDLTSLSYQVTQGAEMIGKAFSQSFMGLISGSMTAKEALASFFKSVGDHFMDMAARMIAKMIEMFILQTILGIAGGAAGGSLTTAASPEAAAIGQGSSIFAAADGAYWPGGFQAFADGGLVTKPTMGLIGEGGESEYVIPASKMQSAMSRYSRGARGEGVLAGSGGGTEGGGAAAAGPMVVDVRYSVERINDVEYVTASQFQAGMRQAAQQGAAQGEQRTLRRLQQSPGTRKRVGM